MTVQGREDDTHRRSITKALLVYWSRRRAWHKDKVKLVVRTELVEDGAKVDIQIHTKDKAVLLDEVKDLVVKDGKIDHDYTIDLKDKPFRPADRELIAIAVLAGSDPVISSPASAPLWVDLEPPLFSV